MQHAPTTTRGYVDGTLTVLRGCHVVDIERGDVASDCDIHIRDGIIAGITRGVRQYTRGDDVVDMGGSWILPGIIDSHVHLFGEPRTQFATSFAPDEPGLVAGLRATRNLHEAMYAGITTVRDMGAFDARAVCLRDTIRQHRILSPRILACGHLLTYPDGHCHIFGRQVRGTSQIRDAVKENMRLGADFVKVASDPEDTEARRQATDPTFTADEFAFLVSECHAHGLKVACHTFPSEPGVVSALRAGVDTLEHAVPLTAGILECLKHGSTMLVPTFVAAYDEFGSDDISAKLSFDFARAKRYDATNIGRDHERRRAYCDVPESIRTWLDRLITHLPIAFQSGLRVGVGSDAGCPGTDFRSALREMFWLSQLGATTLQALQAATVNNAVACGLDHVGLVRPGYVADLIAVPGNPLDKLDVLLEISCVVVGGVVVRTRESYWRNHER